MVGGSSIGILAGMMHSRALRSFPRCFQKAANNAFNMAIQRAVQYRAFAQTLAANLPRAPYKFGGGAQGCLLAQSPSRLPDSAAGIYSRAVGDQVCERRNKVTTAAPLLEGVVLHCIPPNAVGKHDVVLQRTAGPLIAWRGEVLPA